MGRLGRRNRPPYRATKQHNGQIPVGGAWRHHFVCLEGDAGGELDAAEAGAFGGLQSGQLTEAGDADG